MILIIKTIIKHQNNNNYHKKITLNIKNKNYQNFNYNYENNLKYSQTGDQTFSHIPK